LAAADWEVEDLAAAMAAVATVAAGWAVVD